MNVIDQGTFEGLLFIDILSIGLSLLMIVGDRKAVKQLRAQGQQVFWYQRPMNLMAASNTLFMTALVINSGINAKIFPASIFLFALLILLVVLALTGYFFQFRLLRQQQKKQH